MSGQREPQGKRRLDRVLREDYLAGLDTLPIEEVRALRGAAEQEESHLSYVRRLLQGRIDIIRAELQRRAGEGGELVAELPTILAPRRGNPRGSGRHVDVHPTDLDVQRRRAEVLAAGVELADISHRSVEELTATLPIYETEERRQSDQRRAVQQVVDRCGAEIARRYREGEARVADLLPD